MYNCYNHGWSSHFQSCPSCQSFETAASASINMPSIKSTSYKCGSFDAYENMIDELEQKLMKAREGLRCARISRDLVEIHKTVDDTLKEIWGKDTD